MYLCGCSNCKIVLIDPKDGDINYSDDLYHIMDFPLLVLRGGNYICPVCQSQDITDNIKCILFDNNVDRDKIIKAAKSLESTNSKEEYDKLRVLLSKEYVHKDIYQMIESVRIPKLSGRRLSLSEYDKVNEYFKEVYFIHRTLSNNKLYFGYPDEDTEDTILVWGYITEEQVNNIVKPKQKEMVKPLNKELNSLAWYKNLMKKIKQYG